MIKVLTGLVVSEGCKRNSVPHSPLASGGLLAIFCIPLSSLSYGALPVCIWVQIAPFYKDTHLIGL